MQNGRVVSISEPTVRGFQLRDRDSLWRAEIYISCQRQNLELMVTFGRGSVISRTEFCSGNREEPRFAGLPSASAGRCNSQAPHHTIGLSGPGINQNPVPEFLLADRLSPVLVWHHACATLAAPRSLRGIFEAAMTLVFNILIQTKLFWTNTGESSAPPARLQR